MNNMFTFNLIHKLRHKQSDLKQTFLKIYAVAAKAALKNNKKAFGTDELVNEIEKIILKEIKPDFVSQDNLYAEISKKIEEQEGSLIGTGEESFQLTVVISTIMGVIKNKRNEYLIMNLLSKMNTITKTDFYDFNTWKYRLEQDPFISQEERDHALDQIHESHQCPQSISNTVKAVRKWMTLYNDSDSADEIVRYMSSVLQPDWISDDFRVRLNVLIGALGKMSSDACALTNLLVAIESKLNVDDARRKKLDAEISKVKSLTSLSEQQKKNNKEIIILKGTVIRCHEESMAFKKILVDKMKALLTTHQIKQEKSSILLSHLSQNAFDDEVVGYLTNNNAANRRYNNIKAFRAQNAEFDMLASQYRIVEKVQAKLPSKETLSIADTRQISSGIREFNAVLRSNHNRKMLQATPEGGRYLQKIISVISFGLFYGDVWRQSDGMTFIGNLSATRQTRKTYSNTAMQPARPVTWR